LLLPIDPQLESNVATKLKTHLTSSGIAADDHAFWLRSETAAFIESGTPSTALREAVSLCIAEGDPTGAVGKHLARDYFKLIESLSSIQNMDCASARQLLSHARLIAALSEGERLSAAQIADVLAARDSSMWVPWEAIQEILKRMRCAPMLTKTRMMQIYDADCALEESLLIDADLATASELVAETARNLGYAADISRSLEELQVPVGQPDETAVPFMPYFAILHFVCSVAEDFDHALRHVYEFSPRGAAMDSLADKYPSALLPTGSTVLNNMKSVYSLDHNWAAGRKPSLRRQAHALADIIQGLDTMAYLGKRELALWLRMWLIRAVRSLEPPDHRVDALTPDSIRHVFDWVGAEPSGTRGVIEQRVVDAVSSAAHTQPDWYARGVGDPVNATNLSRRKLGDCDFQRTEQHTVVAYEAHAGLLTPLYVDEHVRTLGRILPLRYEEEWAPIHDTPGDWGVQIVFVATQVAAELCQRNETIAPGVSCRLDFKTFAEFLADVNAEEILTTFNERVVDQLNESGTPLEFRRTFTAKSTG
jgi:hypothetical protein